MPSINIHNVLIHKHNASASCGLDQNVEPWVPLVRFFPRAGAFHDWYTHRVFS